MAKLLWDQSGERTYETGVDHGILFVQDAGVYGNGIAWNGLTTVTESPSGAEASAIYADNIKYLNLYSAEEFGATIEAYTYPDEFGVCDGSAEIATGISIGQQERKSFGFAYRTRLGNDQDGDSYGYKIHLIYGCMAAPTEKGYATINDSPEAISFSWSITTTKQDVEGFKPTSLITIDSTKFTSVEAKARLKALEDKLYGTDGSSGTPGTDAYLPLPAEVISTLTAEVETVTLTFNANEHGTAPAAQTVLKGSTATEPANPTAEGYTFGGWYEEAACTNAFSFSTVLNADKTVYAKWTQSEG
jgi:uncharacterized repeat protein (TIGR02543 family)